MSRLYRSAALILSLFLLMPALTADAAPYGSGGGPYNNNAPSGGGGAVAQGGPGAGAQGICFVVYVPTSAATYNLLLGVP